MTNHFHLLVHTARANLSEFMRHFLGHLHGAIQSSYTIARVMSVRAALTLNDRKQNGIGFYLYDDIMVNIYTIDVIMSASIGYL